MPPRATEAAPRRQRKIVELLFRYVLDGLSNKEIAQTLGYSEPNTVRDLKDLMDDGWAQKLDNGRYAISTKPAALMTSYTLYFDVLKARSEQFQNRVLAQAHQQL